MRSLAFACLFACATPAKPVPRPVSAPEPTPAARPHAESRKDCLEYCDMVVLTRHDACGRGGDSPDWCVDDRERMRENCEEVRGCL